MTVETNRFREDVALLKPADVARRLSISKPTLYRLVAKGELPALDVGGQLRFDPLEIDAYIYGDRA